MSYQGPFVEMYYSWTATSTSEADFFHFLLWKDFRKATKSFCVKIMEKSFDGYAVLVDVDLMDGFQSSVSSKSFDMSFDQMNVIGQIQWFASITDYRLQETARRKYSLTRNDTLLWGSVYRFSELFSPLTFRGRVRL